MKTKFCLTWKAVLVLAGLPFVAASLQGPPSDDTPPAALAEAPGAQPSTNVPVPDAALAVSTNSDVRASGPTLPNLQLYGGTAEVVKLAQSGVGEPVMMAYITNTTARFS